MSACGSCRAPLAAGAQFCVACGKPIAAAQPAQPQPAQPQPAQPHYPLPPGQSPHRHQGQPPVPPAQPHYPPQAYPPPGQPHYPPQAYPPPGYAPAPRPAHAPGKSSGPGLWIAIALVLVVLTGGGVALLIAGAGDDHSPPTATAVAPTPSPPETAPPPPAPESDPIVAPVGEDQDTVPQIDFAKLNEGGGGAFVPKQSGIELKAWTHPAAGFSIGLPSGIKDIKQGPELTTMTGIYQGAVVAVVAKISPLGQPAQSLPDGPTVMRNNGATDVTSRKVQIDGQPYLAGIGTKHNRGFTFRTEIAMAARGDNVIAVTITILKADFPDTERLRTAIFASVRLPE